MLQFDPNLPGLIEGNITSVTVSDPDTVGLPNHVINPDSDFNVTITWELTGLIVPLWLAALQPPFGGGNWDVSVYAESLGGGTEAKLGTALVPAIPNPFVPPFEYTATVNVPASSLDEHTPNTDRGGIYKLVVAVFLNSDLPGRFDMTGFREGPIIQVENPV